MVNNTTTLRGVARTICQCQNRDRAVERQAYLGRDWLAQDRLKAV